MTKTKQETLQRKRIWNRKNRDKTREYDKKWKEKNRDHVRQRVNRYIMNRYHSDPAFRLKRNEAQKKWKKKTKPWQKLKNKQYFKLWSQKTKYWQNPEFKQKAKLYYQKNLQKIKKRMKEYRENNPRSSTRCSLELQITMNNVRKRDNNTCQWQNCNLTYKETSIHVNHIFPRSEYPELELIEEYMICYCVKHHKLWHEYRGDSYSGMI